MTSGISDSQLADCKVLIVEDEPINASIIQANLEELGITQFEMAENGAAALEKLAAGSPDLMVLDMQMPVMDGFEVLKRVRREPSNEDLPILVITALEGREARNETLRQGASNMISKPIDTDLLIERVKHLLERRILVRQLREYRERVEVELEIARGMQRALVPCDAELAEIERRYGCRLQAHFTPSSELAGDLWGIQFLDDSRFALFTVDFSGHGVGAALNTFRLHTLMRDMPYPGGSPAAYLAGINAHLVQLLPVGHFATMLLAVIDTAAGTVTYSGAAAPDPLFGNVVERSVRAGDGSGVLLGVSPSVTYEDKVAPLASGDFLFMYSDALTETPDNTGAVLETGGLAALIEKGMVSHCNTVLDNVIEAFYRRRPSPPPDDLTAIWLCR